MGAAPGAVEQEWRRYVSSPSKTPARARIRACGAMIKFAAKPADAGPALATGRGLKARAEAGIAKARRRLAIRTLT